MLLQHSEFMKYLRLQIKASAIEIQSMFYVPSNDKMILNNQMFERHQ